MTTYDFQIVLPDLDEETIERVYATCGDVGIGMRGGVTYADVHREADSLGAAIDSVITDLQRCGVVPRELRVQTPAA